MTSKRGLGRGLGALIPSLNQSEESQFEEIPLASIRPNPHQPRKHFDEESFSELVESIKQFGLVQPVVVRPRGEGFELVAGERRLRAAREAGLNAVPAIIRNSSEAESLEMALVENLQREDLNALEEAAAYKLLIEEFSLTHEELAERVGKKRVTVTNTLRLLQLPVDLQAQIVEGKITSGHARALLSLPSDEEKRKLAARIATEGLSVRQTENIVRLRVSSHETDRARTLQPKPFKVLSKELARILKTKVKIRMGEKSGKLEIQFQSMGDLERIAGLIRSLAVEEKPPLEASQPDQPAWNA